MTTYTERLSRVHGRPVIPYALPVFAAVASCLTWFSPGKFIAGGDVPPFVFSGFEGEYGWIWGHRLTGAGSETFQPPLALVVLISRLTHVLGGSDLLAQRFFYCSLAGLVAFACAYFVSAFTARAVAVAVGGLVGFFNAFVLTQVPNTVALLTLAMMGLLGGMVIRAGVGRPSYPLVFAALTVLSSYVANNPPLLLVLATWIVATAIGTVLLGSHGTLERISRFLVRSVPWALAFNLWWILPAAMTTLGGKEGPVTLSAVTDVRNWSWTHRRNSILNVLTLNTTWAWDFPEYYPYAAALNAAHWDWLRFLLPATGFSAPLVARGRQRTAALVLLAVVLVLSFLGKGLHAPFASVNLWLYDHVPGLWLLREPMGKLGLAIVLVYAALAGLVAAKVVESLSTFKPSKRWATAGLGVGAVAVLIAYPYPLMNGDVVPERRPKLPSQRVALPDDWREAANVVNAAPSGGKVLVLPLNDFYQMPTTWGYYGADLVANSLIKRPVIQEFPGGYFSPDKDFARIVHAVEEALLGNDLIAVPRLLQSLGVSHVLLRHDLDTGFPGRSFTSPARLAPALRATPGLRRLHSFQVVDVYEVQDRASDAVRSYVGLIREPAEREGDIAAAVVAAPSTMAVTTGVHPSDEPVDLSAPAPPKVKWRSYGPAKYEVEVEATSSAWVLVLAESFAPGWKLHGLPDDVDARHFEVDGYANGWRIGAHRQLTLVAEYAPAMRARRALDVARAAGALCLALVALRLAARRLRRPMPADHS